MEEEKYKNIKNSKNIFEYKFLDKSIKNYLSSWLKYLELEFSKNTILAYEKDLRKFLNFFCWYKNCLLYTSPSPRDGLLSRMPSSA